LSSACSFSSDPLDEHGTLVGLTAGTLLRGLVDGSVELTGGASVVVDASVVVEAAVELVEGAGGLESAVVVDAAVVVEASVVVVVDDSVVLEPVVVVVSPGSCAGMNTVEGRGEPCVALATAPMPPAIRATPTPTPTILRTPSALISLGSFTQSVTRAGSPSPTRRLLIHRCVPATCYTSDRSIGFGCRRSPP
jgi:hypothetical protein